MSCYTKKRVSRLVTPNPTTYVFDADIEEVVDAIKEKKRTLLHYGGLRFKGDRIFYDTSIYNNPNNINDAILVSIDYIKSKTYYRFGEPAPYNVNFHLHLESISEHKTKVEIFTLEPKIVLFEIGIAAIHFGFTWMKKVPPSTIEEYEILLIIGKELGEKGMPACNYPKKWLEYQEKKKRQVGRPTL